VARERWNSETDSDVSEHSGGDAVLRPDGGDRYVHTYIYTNTSVHIYQIVYKICMNIYIYVYIYMYIYIYL